MSHLSSGRTLVHKTDESFLRLFSSPLAMRKVRILQHPPSLYEMNGPRSNEGTPPIQRLKDEEEQDMMPSSQIGYVNPVQGSGGDNYEDHQKDSISDSGFELFELIKVALTKDSLDAMSLARETRKHSSDQTRKRNERVVDVRHLPFPLLLYKILLDAARDRFEGVVGWRPHGRAFKISNRESFGKHVLPQ